MREFLSFGLDGTFRHEIYNVPAFGSDYLSFSNLSMTGLYSQGSMSSNGYTDCYLSFTVFQCHDGGASSWLRCDGETGVPTDSYSKSYYVVPTSNCKQMVASYTNVVQDVSYYSTDSTVESDTLSTGAVIGTIVGLCAASILIAVGISWAIMKHRQQYQSM